MLAGLCTVTHPFRAVKEVLDHFYDRFCEEMDASSIVWQLVQEGIIDDGDRTQIIMELNRRVQNQILHSCLKQKCTWDAFNTACDMIINVPGNPLLTALGNDMQRRLQTGKCAYMCKDTQVCALHPYMPHYVRRYVQSVPGLSDLSLV